MNKYIVLTKILLKNGSSSLSNFKKKKVKSITILLIIVLALLPSVILFVDFIRKTYDFLFTVNQQGLILVIGISFVNIFILFFGILYSLNVLYFSKDIDYLLPLPVRPWQILGAKFTVALFYEYITETIILLPIIIIYGIKSSSGVLYYIYGIIIFLALPIVPLGAATLLNVIIMSFTNIGKHKDILKIIGGIMGMALGLTFNIWMQKIGRSTNNPEQLIKLIKEGNNSLVTISDKLFPGSSISVKALVFNNKVQGLSYLLMFLFITLIVTLIILTIGQKLYFKGVIGSSEIMSNRRELSFEELNKFTEKKSPITTLMIREIKLLVRTPIYFINCILMNFLWPIFILIPAFTQPEMLNNIGKVSDLIRNHNIIGTTLGLALAIGTFMSASNAITASAISREGQNIFICKYIPVSYSVQLIAKILAGVLAGVVAIVMMIIVAIILVKPPVYLVIIMLIASLPGIVFSSFTGILIDLNYPKLNWDNEVKAVKQNFNVFINLLIGLTMSSIVAVLTIIYNRNSIFISIVSVLAFIVADYILYKIITTKGAIIFENIEG